MCELNIAEPDTPFSKPWYVDCPPTNKQDTSLHSTLFRGGERIPLFMDPTKLMRGSSQNISAA